MMDKFMKFLKAALFPHWCVILLSSMVGFPLMIESLIDETVLPAIAYGSYLLSGYAFTVLCIGFPGVVRRGKEWIYGDKIRTVVITRNVLLSNKATSRYIRDADYRSKVSLYSGLVVNSLFGMFKCVTGCYYRSPWFIAIGIYYIVLGMIRFVLLHNVRRTEQEAHLELRKRKEWLGYRSCGIMMLLMDITMVGMIIQMVWQDKSNFYIEWTVYLSAIYTFYYFTTALISMIKFFRWKNALVSAAKNVSLAGAAMSVLMLQTTMLTSFGDGIESNRLMNGITGTVVSLFCVGLAIFMIVWSNYNMYKLKNMD